jgi:hypothetical protein
MRLLWWLAALSLGFAASPASAATPPLPAFIANAAVVDRTEALAPELVNRYFNVPTAFQFVSSASASYSPFASLAAGVQSFTDETKLEQAVSSASLAPGTRAVLYDAENWSLTPTAQQQDPATYYQRAEAVAHTAGLLLIAAPGTDLANVVDRGSEPVWQRFLASGLPASIAQHADVYVVQSQLLEANLTSYESYVRQASYAATGANANVEVLSGVSTNPNGQVQTSQTMLDAALSVAAYASGWWVNDPVAGAGCPNCTGPYTQSMVGFLRGLSPVGMQQSPTITTTTTTTMTTATTPPPTITGVSQSHRRWRAGSNAARFAAAAKPPIGTTFRFALSENGTVRFAFAQLVPGRKVNGSCVPRTAANRNRTACKRPAARGSLLFRASAGAHKLTFQGRLPRAGQLKPGTYTVTMTATNATRQWATSALTFTIIPG